MTTDITVSVTGHVALVEINRPPANFFDRVLIGQIADAAGHLCKEGARAIVLCAEGKHFCAGANFSSGEMESDRERSSELLYREATRLFEIPIPVIAAVQGSVVGGGLGLACAADFRVAAASSRYHANFSMLGFHQGFGLSVTLPELVGAQHAADLLYTSRKVSAADALAMGLVDRVVDDGDERAEALTWASEIATAAPLAVRSMKATLRSGLADRVRAILSRELSEQRSLWPTEDSTIGIAANLARAKPEFTGR